MVGNKNVNVLIVDDEKDFRDLFAELVNRMGYSVITAENGKEALEKIKKKPIQAAIIDYNMPGMNGLELLTQIKKRDTNIFVVLISGYGNGELETEAIKMGVDVYVVKPMDINKLQDALQKALR